MFGLLAGACATDTVEISAHATIAQLHALLTFMCSGSWLSGDKPLAPGIDLALAQGGCIR
jgi:hypothetical protein